MPIICRVAWVDGWMGGLLLRGLGKLRQIGLKAYCPKAAFCFAMVGKKKKKIYSIQPQSFYFVLIIYLICPKIIYYLYIYLIV